MIRELPSYDLLASFLSVLGSRVKADIFRNVKDDSINKEACEVECLA